MSNLKLPTLTYAALADRIKDGQTLHIGYMTTAEKVGGLGDAEFIMIRHHYSTIAVLYKDGTVYITNAGYDSSTTRNRINHVLRDNNIRAGVTQRKGVQTLVIRPEQPALFHSTEHADFINATFSPNGRVSAVNDHQYEGQAVT